MTRNAKNSSGPLDTILRIARKNAPAARDESATFFKHYFSDIDPEDLADKEPRAVYEAALRHRDLAARRPPQQALVDIYNPEVRLAPYTVINVVTDDMPFLVDSVRMELNRQGFIVHLMIHPVYAVTRSPQGRLRSISPQAPATQAAECGPESFIYVEIDRIVDPARMEQLRQGLERVLEDVRKAVQDWLPMLERMQEVVAGLNASVVADGLRSEAQQFLQWLTERNFTFLGHEKYAVEARDGTRVLREVPRSALGISRGRGKIAVEPLVMAGDNKRKKPALADVLLIRKSVRRSTVHRPGYLDYISVRRFDAEGRVVGEDRFLGLYTSMAYRRHPQEVPIIGRKIGAVLRMAQFDPVSHRGKAFAHILETYPRDELFQISERDLYAIALGILHLESRQKLRLFVREDPLRCFISCLIYMPRDLFDTDLRLKISALISERFKAIDLSFSVRLTDESFARIEYFLRVRPDDFPAYDAPAIERELQEISWSWKDRFRNVVLEKVPEELSSGYLEAFVQAFPAAYREDYDPAEAFDDALVLGRLSDKDSLKVNLYVKMRGGMPQLRLKLYHYELPIPPSDSLPILENMGVRVLQERPYRIASSALATPCWIYDYELQHQADVSRVGGFKPVFEEIFASSWHGDIESDGFNALALIAGLTAREIIVLRACCKYLLQAGLPFSQAYIEQCARKHPSIVAAMLRLFTLRFRLDVDSAVRQTGCAELLRGIEQALDAVTSLDEDRILRNFLGLILAAVRTNFFKAGENADLDGPLAFKFDPAKITELPEPRPLFEIFVYSPRVEGVHLRMGKVARGGLRWSDRREDYRTEILGLVKAQRVKNAVIVPTGAKGGFTVKRPPASAGRDAVLQEAVACYRQFVGSLLELTDNLVEGKAAPPEGVLRYDPDDTYLVVAADKGTAAFSDYANEVARNYGFWLDDAFASGGSQGYDHKKMGITARGAWESVKLHFRDLGKDIQTQPFTVVGIGDMSGDVFGNGMLLSNRIKLVAAFNHIHIFLDPDPDPERSFRERARLFALPRSTWEDYQASLLSPGGGIYLRTAKSIDLSPQVQALLGTSRKQAAPNELIQLMLKAPVDLLWNGGIGTYAKASFERNQDAGDRGNDGLRVNGRDLRCKVIGEGGNLGMTQRARIEYALNGGRADADFIHNAGGVNCSDHEVNIKILLNMLTRARRLTAEQRGRLLVEMTDEVADLVLQSNYWQTQAITLVETEAYAMLDEHARYIRHLEMGGHLDRDLEALPDDDQLAERKAAGRGLTRPEIALLISYSKMIAETELVDSDLWEDPYFAAELLRYFPTPLRAQYESFIHKHPLRVEILAMFIANRMINRMGFSFAFRMQEETGATLPEVVRAYTIAWEVFSLRGIWAGIAALDNKVPAALQNRMMLEAVELINRASRWLIHNRRRMLGIRGAIIDYGEGAQAMAEWLPGMLERSQDKFIHGALTEYKNQGIDRPLALRVLAMDALYCTFDIVDICRHGALPIAIVMQTYFELSAYLDIFWLRVQMQEYKVNSHWEDLARQASIDDLYKVLAALTREVLKAGAGNAPARERIEAWHKLNKAAVERSRRIMVEMKTVEHPDLAMFAVSLRELQNLERASGAGTVN
ncbi:MAG TPA: NAD-glutamate dehydrogenase [Gammaproteobacteria bacterium]|nr:NAD-glutamate dehydrogenase [Gammaproteobacteria bacterium]